MEYCRAYLASNRDECLIKSDTDLACILNKGEQASFDPNKVSIDYGMENNENIFQKLIEILQNCSNLRELNISNMDLAEDDILRLGDLKESIKYVSFLENNLHADNPKVMKEIATLLHGMSLEQIEIHNNFISPLLFTDLVSNLPKQGNLKSVSFRGTGARLLQFPKNTARVSYADSTFTVPSDAVVPESVKDLALVNCGITDDGATKLSNAVKDRHDGKLQLNLDHNRVTNEGLANIVQGKPGRLQFVSLNNNPIQDITSNDVEGVKTIALYHTGVGDHIANNIGTAFVRGMYSQRTFNRILSNNT